MTVILHHGDCKDIVPTIAPQSVDAIITDIPYGTTACKWDEIIPFPVLWQLVKHVLKPRGVFVTTASQPFTSALVMSNPHNFKHSLHWDKMKSPTGHLNAKIQPMRRVEDVLVFGFSVINYYPIMTKGKAVSHSGTGNTKKRIGVMGNSSYIKTTNRTERYPIDLIRFEKVQTRNGRLHPTQKPVALYEYLIKTYTNEGDTVLDFTMGSGTTGVGCVNTRRNFIGVEKELNYFAIAEKRIKQAQAARQLELV